MTSTHMLRKKVTDTPAILYTYRHLAILAAYCNRMLESPPIKSLLKSLCSRSSLCFFSVIRLISSTPSSLIAPPAVMIRVTHFTRHPHASASSALPWRPELGSPHRVLLDGRMPVSEGYPGEVSHSNGPPKRRMLASSVAVFSPSPP